MFQDIGSHIFDNQYHPRAASSQDYLIVVKEDCLLLRESDMSISIPSYGDISARVPLRNDELIYLFSIDATGFYLYSKELDLEGFRYCRSFELMNLEPSWIAYGAATAYHLGQWYSAHHYCGRCSAEFQHGENERAVYCPSCGQIEYPKIAPVVIVGIGNGDELLLTKSANSPYKKYALVAGFMEIGETFEDTVKREVMEEVGLRVKKIRYYKSQPWGLSESVLMGFFAEVEGSTTVCLDENELLEATWFKREDIPADDAALSLTWDMIELFRAGAV